MVNAPVQQATPRDVLRAPADATKPVEEHSTDFVYSAMKRGGLPATLNGHKVRSLKDKAKLCQSMFKAMATKDELPLFDNKTVRDEGERWTKVVELHNLCSAKIVEMCGEAGLGIPNKLAAKDKHMKVRTAI